MPVALGSNMIFTPISEY